MSTPSMPSAKRRRVDAANETLKKPFRSPLVKQPQPAASGPEPSSDSPASPAAPDQLRDKSTPSLSSVSTPSKQPSRRQPPAKSATTRAFTTPSKPTPGPVSASPLPQKHPHDPGPLDASTASLLATLQQRREEARLAVRRAEKEAELVQQAARIQSGKGGETTNEELEALVRKWKAACRMAAEELFELIRGRVDSLGGGAAWRETRQRQRWGFDGEEEGTSSESKERGEEDVREELEGLEEVEGEKEEESEERDFTMHMMLKSLSIDPKVVGYDPAEDKWQD